MSPGPLFKLPWRVTAADIAQPIFTRTRPSTLISEIDWGAEPADAWWEAYALVEEDGRAIGLFSFWDNATGPTGVQTVGEYIESIEPSQIIASDTPLETLLALFTQRRGGYYILLTHDKLTHFLWPHNFVGPPVRMALFAKILELEAALDATLSVHAKEYVSRLPDERRRKLLDIARRWGFDPSASNLLRCCTFGQKWSLLRHDSRMRNRISFLSEDAAKKIVSRVAMLRDLIAHGHELDVSGLLQTAEGNPVPRREARSIWLDELHSLFVMVTQITADLRRAEEATE